jgi:hypothetical protein
MHDAYQLPAVGLPQHADQHRPQCPVILAAFTVRPLVQVKREALSADN